ncbi:hypothetical protein GYMLUDRAFT_261641 [Collybiopsis luxurians FD-317 M1]|uniref:Alpha/beta hydrolase fold-3 domain-containing protein n=1 Tax=Collybiopsis luxurians FD-317 M1 TaxID=944289 RepID=A0A0D0B925_9AGAR|nr:hypothetical protein GYMLUDRAFT_261641 [Collybiopsis luxurians FD-317 M1]
MASFHKLAYDHSYPYGAVTLREKLPFIYHYWQLVLRLLWKTIKHPVSSENSSLQRVLWRTWVRTIIPAGTPKQLQWILPNTAVTYEQYMKKEHPKDEIINEYVGEGATLHWIGPRDAKRVLLYFHGGGYAIPALYGHFQLVGYWKTKLYQEKGIDMSVAFLEYSLINQAPWPSQYKQTILSLKHLLDSGIPPSNITIGGDSCGGHMAAVALGHLLHPQPMIAPVISIPEPLAGALIVSPWVSYSTGSNSYSRNAPHELLPVKTLEKWADWIKDSREYSGVKDDDYFFQPRDAPTEWWHKLETVVKRVLITAGELEVMRDDAIELSKRMQSGQGPDVDCFVETSMGHNEPLVGFSCGDSPNLLGKSTQVALKWLEYD